MQALKGAQLQARDLKVLTDLFECRVMSLAHVTSLHFDGKKEAAKKRVQRLKESGFIRERPRSIGEPSLLHLTKKGFLHLRETGAIDRFPQIGESVFERRSEVSTLTLRHELEVMDVRVAFYKAINENPSLSIAEFTTWPALSQFTTQLNHPVKGRRDIVVKPDGFLRIQEEAEDGKYEHAFFLEVDRSTESLEVIAQKATCYLNYYQTGGLAMRFGAKREEFHKFPFRVLMVFRTDERRNNATERLLRNDPPIMTQVWVSTALEVMSSPLGAIWIRPKDYRHVIREEESLASARLSREPYGRHIKREKRAHTRIEKISLF